MMKVIISAAVLSLAAGARPLPEDTSRADANEITRQNDRVKEEWWACTEFPSSEPELEACQIPVIAKMLKYEQTQYEAIRASLATRPDAAELRALLDQIVGPFASYRQKHCDFEGQLHSLKAVAARQQSRLCFIRSTFTHLYLLNGVLPPRKTE